jgi:hypothetical protein
VRRDETSGRASSLPELTQITDFAQISSSPDRIQGSRIKRVLGEIADKGNQFIFKFDSSRISDAGRNVRKPHGVRRQW